MECMEAKALKSSFSSEIAVKSANPGGGNLDDIWCVSGGGVDDFSIDEFFDLPNEEDDVVFDGQKDGVSSFEEEEEEEEEDEEEEEEKDSNCSGSISSSHEPVHDSVHFSTHLGIPDDDMQELELWSHFMDDSVPEPNIACPKPTMVTHNTKTGFGFVNRVEPYSKPVNLVRVSYFPTAVPVKPRSKRSRTVVNRSWFSGSPPKTESSSSSSSPSSPVSTLLYSPPAYEMGVFFAYGKPPAKKPKKRPTLPMPGASGDTGLNPAVQRRCTHCQVTKTPQWRAGPNGPKTLCNACGVRFKSGRLFPEYRPACSPTFSSEVHSNSHRKVLEMRRRKEMTEPFPVNGSVNPLSSN